MKQIIAISKTGRLTINNGKSEISKILKYSYSWHYAELQSDTKSLTTSYWDFLARENYAAFKSETKKEKKLGGQYSYFYTDWFPIKFSVANFVSYEIVTSYHEQRNYTLQNLIEKLPADEMIEYLKDNGLNVCPIVR